MNNEFAKAMTTVYEADTSTENGCPAYSSTNSAVVNLYYRLVRNIEGGDLITLLEKGWREDALGTVKLIFQSRDCRGGKGDRDPFRVAYDWLISNHPLTAMANLTWFKEYGYWKDVLPLFRSSNEMVKALTISLYVEALREGDRLAFKYAPRLGGGKKGKKKFHWAAPILREALKISEKSYRKYLKNNSETVEQLMCEGRWGEINYEHVPSIAMKRYRGAFRKHDGERFQAFLDAVSEGKASIKAGQLYPHDLLVNCKLGKGDQTTNLQWAELVKQVKELGILRSAVPIIDMSGSMTMHSAKLAENLYCGDVALALGLLLTEVVEEPWKDMMLSFTDYPEFTQFYGKTLAERYKETRGLRVGYSTDFEAVFSLILSKAKKANLTQEQMPSMVIALTDGQFDEFDSNYNNSSAQESVKQMYKDAGYEAPILVFWNLNSKYSNMPARKDESNILFLSGFSPSAIQYLLSKGVPTPEKVVEGILKSPRYEKLSVVD